VLCVRVVEVMGVVVDVVDVEKVLHVSTAADSPEKILAKFDRCGDKHPLCDVHTNTWQVNGLSMQQASQQD